MCTLLRLPESTDVFPEEIVGKIITNFSNEGDLIYDPFMGTGTTAVVSKKLKRNYVGSELTPKYFEIINKRLLELESQLF